MTLSQTRPATKRLHYAWIIVAITFAAVAVTAGMRTTPGVLIIPLEAEFGWSRATISFAVLAGTVVAFLPLLALVMRDRPEDLGLARYGDKAGAKPAPRPAGNPVAVAFRALASGVRSRDFWRSPGAISSAAPRPTA